MENMAILLAAKQWLCNHQTHKQTLKCMSQATLRKLCSCLALFKSNEIQPSAPCGSGPKSAKVVRQLRSWSEMELADEVGSALSLAPCQPRSEFRS